MIRKRQFHVRSVSSASGHAAPEYGRHDWQGVMPRGYDYEVMQARIFRIWNWSMDECARARTTLLPKVHEGSTFERYQTIRAVCSTISENECYSWVIALWKII